MFETWDRSNAVALKLHFGKPGRILTAALVLGLDGKSFFQHEAIQALESVGEAGSGTRLALEQFAKSEMLIAVNDGKRRYYTEIMRPFWDAYRAIAVAVALPLVTANGEKTHKDRLTARMISNRFSMSGADAQLTWR
jgi:hypothetical protein